METSERIVVSAEALEAQAGKVQTLVTALQKSFERMKQYVVQTESFWKGEAADAHREAYNRNQPSIEEILSRYNEHVIDLEQMAGIYRDGEKKAENLADQLPASNL